MKQAIYWLFGWIFLMNLATVQADMISGQVLTADGKPAAQAQVWVTSITPGISGEYREVAIDKNGVFQTELKASVSIPHYYGRVLIACPGFAPTSGVLRKRNNLFRLEPALPLRVRVWMKAISPWPV